MNRPSFIEPLLKTGRTYFTNVDPANYLDNDWNSISYWEWRIRSLEHRRTRYNKKAAWSMIDIIEVEEIDHDLNEAYMRINDLQAA